MPLCAAKSLSNSVALMVAMAVFAPFFGTVDPQKVSPIFRLREPSQRFWFGTDLLGRDIYSRVVYGTRISTSIGLIGVAISLVLGVILGGISGYFGGAIDTFVQCVAHELPRQVRINVVNPTVLEEAWGVYGEMMPGFQPVPGSLVGKAFERSVDGFITGKVLFVDA